MNERYNSKHCLIVILLFSLSIMLPQLLSSDYFGSIVEDAFTYTSWASQFIDALKEGVVYPRWNPINFWGYGSPTFTLYSPLSFYMAAMFNIFCDSVISAMNICKFTAFLLSTAGLFFLVKEFYPPKTALLAAIFYIFLPFNIFELYFTGGFASMISIAWFPVLILLIFRFVKTHQYSYLLYAGICYAGLILTHLLNAYMFTFAIIFFITWLTVIERQPKNLTCIVLIALIGFLLSAAYLMPLVFEKPFVSLGTFVEDFHYSDFFFIPNKADGFPPNHTWRYFHKEYTVNLIYMIATLLAVIIATTKSKQSLFDKDMINANHFFIGLAAMTIFFLFGISSLIWETIPFFKYIQFPSRWLHITAFAIAFISASWFHILENSSVGKIASNLLITTPFLVSLLLDSHYISSSHVFPAKELTPAKSINLTLEHLPAGVKLEKLDKRNPSSPKATIIEGNGKADTVIWQSAERVIEINAEQPSVLRVRTFNFPGWTAYIDGIRTEINTERDTRVMLVNVPAGKHRMRLVFRDTPVRLAGKLISLATAIVMIVIFSAKIPRTRKGGMT